jgi:HK97 family phage portal protein
MPIVQSGGALRAVNAAMPTSAAFGSMSGGLITTTASQLADYRMIYATQPNVRTCVDFLGRNVAQLGLHVFRRVSDTDRQRLADHDLARWFTTPTGTTCRYRLFEDLICDLGIYFSAYWLKVPYTDGDGRAGLGFLRLPPEEVEVQGTLLPTAYFWTRNGRRKEFRPDQVVHFRGFNPLNPLIGLSPLETLRRILSEEAAASAHRTMYWLNSARHEGVIEQSKEAPNWNPTQLNEFRNQWQEFAGGGAKVGQTAILPKGMTYKGSSWSAKDSEYVLGRKLTREECAAAYHIPQPFVGILDHATFSNIKEQHKSLYQDTLGPWLEWIEEEIEAQVLPESTDTAAVYVEFNIADKLKGSFEEQAGALSTLVGRPVMTANEARARLNLPSIDTEDASTLAKQQGGPAAAPLLPPDDTTATDNDATTVVANQIIEAAWQRQRAKLARLPVDARIAGFDHGRWTRELAADLAPLYGFPRAHALATRINDDTYARLVQGADNPFTDRAVDLAEAA